MGSIQRGGIVRKNDNGTLERVDGTNTYIGSATLSDGKVITKRFRCTGFDEDEVAERWLKWQGKNAEKMREAFDEKEADMAEKTVAKKNALTCPFSGGECGYKCPIWNDGRCALAMLGIGMYNIACNLMKLKTDDELELIAMAIAELGGKEPVEEPSEADGLEAFLEGKSFIDFVNLHSKGVHAQYKKVCDGLSLPAMGEKELTAEIEKRFPELVVHRQVGGSVFKAA